MDSGMDSLNLLLDNILFIYFIIIMPYLYFIIINKKKNNIYIKLLIKIFVIIII